MLPKLCCIHSSLHATNHPLQRGNTHSFFSLDYITPPCDVSEHMVWAPQLFLCFFPIKEACRATPSWTSVHHHWPCCSSLCLAILMEVLLCPCHASWHLGPQPPFCFGSSRHIHTHTPVSSTSYVFVFNEKAFEPTCCLSNHAQVSECRQLLLCEELRNPCVSLAVDGNGY